MKKSIFIDGSFLFHHAQSLNIRIDYKRLKQLLVNPEDMLVGATFYSALPPEAEMDDKHKSFLRIIKKEARFKVKTVPLLKTHPVTERPNRYVKGEDILLACEMVYGALMNHFDIAVLVSGDGDFIPAVNMVQNAGKQVIVAAFRTSFNHILDQEANDVIYLDDHLDEIKLS